MSRRVPGNALWESRSEFPHDQSQSYEWEVSDATTHTITVDDRGRFVLPSDVRDRHGWHTGTELVAVDIDTGLLDDRHTEVQQDPA